MDVGAQSPRVRQRWALGIEYDGSAFCGWQRQRHAVSVQACLEAALARVAAHPVTVHCAGRTDTGVHALEQIVHFNTTASRPPRAWIYGTNAHLPATVSVLWACLVPDEFHARFSAVARHYRYLILCTPTRPALWRTRVTWSHQPLDLAAMQRAAAALVGTHDFSSFRAQECQAKSPVRTVYYLELHRHGTLIELRIGADGFLHHMVRNIAGVLLAIGRGAATSEWTQILLAQRERRLGGVTAPAQGLYLARVDYPPRFALPQRIPDEKMIALFTTQQILEIGDRAQQSVI